MTQPRQKNGAFFRMNAASAAGRTRRSSPATAALLATFAFFALFMLLMSAFSIPVFASAITESDIAPSLLSAIRDTTGLKPVFPLQEDDPFFQQTSLNLNGRSVTSLKGIHYFTRLTRLTAEYNRIPTLRGIVFPESIQTLSLAHNNIAELAEVERHRDSGGSRGG